MALFIEPLPPIQTNQLVNSMQGGEKGMRRVEIGQLGRLDNSRYNEYINLVARGIQSELKQTKPFESLEAEAIVALMRTADLLDWRITEALKPFDVSPTQYNCLRILRGAGSS